MTRHNPIRYINKLVKINLYNQIFNLTQNKHITKSRFITPIQHDESIIYLYSKKKKTRKYHTTVSVLALESQSLPACNYVFEVVQDLSL